MADEIHPASMTQRPQERGRSPAAADGRHGNPNRLLKLLGGKGVWGLSLILFTLTQQVAANIFPNIKELATCTAWRQSLTHD
jgi:hypothetical protein